MSAPRTTAPTAGQTLAEAPAPIPVVFLHGIGAGADGYDDVLARVENGRALDMPGFGEEPWEREATFENLADWLNAKLDGLPPAILFGHSFGGMLAIETAVRHPGAVAGLVLCGATPAFGGRDDTFKTQFLAQRLGPLEKGATMLDLGRASARGMAAPGAPEDRLEAFAQSMGRVPQAVFRDILQCLVTFDRRDALAGLSLPVVCMSGAEDKAAPARTVAKMNDRLPDSQLMELSCGHLIPLEDPQACADAVAAVRARLETVR